MKKYYLHNGSEQVGPFDIDELKSKNLTKDTPIWFEGIPDWTTAGQIEELKGIFITSPPPFTNRSVQTSTLEKNAESRNSKKSSFLGRKLFLFIGVLVLIMTGIYVYDLLYYQRLENERRERVTNEENLEKSRIESEVKLKESIRNNINSYITVQRNEFKYSELGGIFGLKITVSNTTDYLIENVRVQVTYLKDNGDVWDTKLVDYNILSPNTKTTKDIEDTDRGTSIKYEIISIKSKALGL